MRQLFEGPPCKVCGSTVRRKPKGNRKTGACNQCTTEKEKQYYKNNKKKYADRGKKWFANNKEKVREYGRREVTKNQNKVKARKEVYYAIRKGQLDPVSTKTCEDCGKQAQHHHHEDYSKPLEVVALCNLCHAARHTNQTN